MASQPDNKIEELLKAYARKRREEAGAPFELHPATRKLLQAEVARHWRKAGAAPLPFLQSLVKLWPRLAFAASVVILLGVVVWVANLKPGVNSEMRLAKNEKKPAEDALAPSDKASKDSPTRGYAEAKQPAPALTPAAPSGPAPTRGYAWTAKELDNSKLAFTNSIALNPSPTAAPDNALFFRVQNGEAAARRSEAQGSGGGGGGFGGFGRTTGQAGGLTSTNSSLGQLGENPGAQAGVSSGLATGVDLYASDKARLALNSPAGQPASPAGIAPSDTRGLSETELKLRETLAPSQPPQPSTAVALSMAPEGLVRKLEAPHATPPPAPSTAQKDLAQMEKTAQLQDQYGYQLDALKATAGVALAKADNQLKRVDQAGALGGGRIHFSQQSVMLDDDGLQSPATPVPLSSFDLERVGDRIRIWDADGSVYEGQVAVGPRGAIAVDRTLGVAEKAKREPSAPEPGTIQSAPQPVQFRDAESSQQGGSFQASGTNRSLNQLVVINGLLISATGLEAGAAPAVPAIRQAQSAVTQPPPPPATAAAQSARFQSVAPGQTTDSVTLARTVQTQRVRFAAPSVLRIQGRARVGTTNQLEINAVGAPR